MYLIFYHTPDRAIILHPEKLHCSLSETENNTEITVRGILDKLLPKRLCKCTVCCVQLLFSQQNGISASKGARHNPSDGGTGQRDSSQKAEMLKFH